MSSTATSASTGVSGPRELLSGLDTLDLTCKSPAPCGLLEDLGELQAEARVDERQAVTLDVGDARFKVASRGMGVWWPFRLDHAFGQLAVGNSPNRPAWRVSPTAEALHCEGVGRVVEFWRSIIETLTGGPVVLMVSRLDVHADFADLGIADEDRTRFACRSGRQSVEFEYDNLETLYFGKGGDLIVRVYDKLAEVAASGRGGYLLGAYGSAGLREGESVQRVEAQIRRRTLRQLGVERVEDAIGRAGAVYAYVTGKWLRLQVPSNDTNRSRWPLDPRWVLVQSARIASGVDPAHRIIAERHAPGLDTITANVYGWLVSAGAALGIDDLDVVARQVTLLAHGYSEDKGRDFGREVRARRLDLGSPAASVA